MSYAQAKLYAKLEDFARLHRHETKAGLILMSFLNGDCEHMGDPCELCGHSQQDIYDDYLDPDDQDDEP